MDCFSCRISKTGSGPGTKVCVSLSEGIDSQALIASDDVVEGKVSELTPKGSADAIRWACTSDLAGLSCRRSALILPASAVSSVEQIKAPGSRKTLIQI